MTFEDAQAELKKKDLGIKKQDKKKLPMNTKKARLRARIREKERK